MNTALVGADLVDLIHDDPLNILELLPEDRGGEDDSQRLWGCDEDVGRLPRLTLPFARRGVPGPDGDPDLGRVQVQLIGKLLHLAEWLRQVLVDIIGQGLQRRDVEAVDLVLQFPLPLQLIELVDDRKKGRQGLP